MEKSNLDRLLQRYINGEASPQERVKLEAWLEILKTEDTPDLELTSVDEEKLFQKITANAYGAEGMRQLHPHVVPARSIYSRRGLQIAATLLMFTVFGIGWLWLKSDTQIAVATTGNHEKVILHDGSIVWMSKDSHVEYGPENNGGTREAGFHGEALFEIAKDPRHPFIIDCGEVSVKVVGTSFSLKTMPDKIEIMVLTGKVHLYSNADRFGVDVLPNERVSYNSRGVLEKIPDPEQQRKSIVGYDEYNMEFTNTSMEMVFQKLAMKFNISFIYEDSQVNKCRITADLTDRQLETSLQMLSELLELTYSIDQNTVRISGNGCD